mgnify:CR=1 FL=1|jgi:hypothetical protein
MKRIIDDEEKNLEEHVEEKDEIRELKLPKLSSLLSNSNKHFDFNLD